MTITLPDMTGPAQPPCGDGNRFLQFAAVSAAVYVFGVLVIALAEALTR